MRIKWLLLISILLAGYASHGQLRRVVGQVTDATDGKPLVQLSVLLKGSTVGVVTDADGRYSIEVPGSDAVLQFLYMGMESQEVEVGERTEINISMRPSTEAIEQVVVMGYGSGKKVSSTVGRVSSVAGRAVQAHPTANALDGIAGRVPGLSVLSYTGEPSEAGSIRLHGAGSLGASSAPLIVVDGLPVSTETLLSINPQDFERVDILTDASATSIYGSRAANGVIYVTTKQGHEGEKASVMARYSFGLSNLASTRYYDQMQTTTEAFAMFEELGTVAPAVLENLRAKYGHNNYQWYKYYYQQNAPVHTADISLTGGTKASRYYLSAGYFYSKGLRPLSGYQRYNLRANYSSRVSRYVRTGLNLGLTYDAAQVNPDDPFFSASGPAMLYPSWRTPYDENGKEYPKQIPDTEIINPRHRASHVFNTTHTAGLTSLAFVQVEPVQRLIFRSQGGLQYSSSLHPDKTLPTYVEAAGYGSAGESNATSVLMINSNTLEYKLDLLDDHHLTPLIGQEYTYSFAKGFSALGLGFRDERLMLLGQSVPASRQINSSWNEGYFFSLFGRLEYSYQDRYYLDLSIRDDASSKFTRRYRNAIFYSVGAMWRAKNEAFLHNVEWLDELTLKSSVGTSGNSSIAAYQTHEYVGPSGIYQGRLGLGIVEPGNPDLQWEKQTLFTVGASLGVLRRVKLDISFYRRHTSSMLMRVPRPLTSGFASIQGNTGRLNNTGIDLRLEVTAWQDARGNFVTPYLVFNYNRQEVEKLFDGRKFWRVPGTNTFYAVGKPVEIYYPRFYRVNPDNGKAEWYLANPDDPSVPQMDPNRITDDATLYTSQYQSLGKPRYAPYIGGFGLNLSLWGVYLDADFNFQLGKWMISADKYSTENPLINRGKNQSKKITPDSYWKRPGDRATYPSKNEPLWMGYDSRMLSDASFCRMKNLTVGYQFPKSWMQKTRALESAKIYLAFRNLLTFTKFDGVDPEPDVMLTTDVNPATKQYSIGVEINF